MDLIRAVGAAHVTFERYTDRRCPKCGAYRAMDNPVEHSREKRPFMCLDCSETFNAPQDTE